LVNTGPAQEVTEALQSLLRRPIDEQTLRATVWVLNQSLGNQVAQAVIAKQMQEVMGAQVGSAVATIEVEKRNLDKAKILLESGLPILLEPPAIELPALESRALAVIDGKVVTIPGSSVPLLAAVGQARDEQATWKSLVPPGQAAAHFSVLDMNGTHQRLFQFRGKKNVLLTFFPKCFTGGCANHLSSLRDQYTVFQANDTEVLAVSVDPAEGEKGQKAFAKQWNLPFALIPDTERKLSLLYGAAVQPTDFARRMTVLIDKQGIVRLVDTAVNVRTHGIDMVAKMRELGLVKNLPE
jgi:peroxiredoxin Q/BCP